MIHTASCIHEDDDGVLWEHVDVSGAETRRARRLVVSSSSPVGNYEYVYWRPYQDGSIPVRGPGDRDHGHQSGHAGSAAVRDGRRGGGLCVLPPTFQGGAARPRRRR